MDFKINNTSITKPLGFTVRLIEVVDAESSMEMADGSMNRDVIATKRQIDISFDALSWTNCSNILSLIDNNFFDFYYPDPLIGAYTTKKFYVAEKTAPFLTEIDGKIFWSGLSFTLIEG